jgi:C-terminal processing protease CtpA/Prc
MIGGPAHDAGLQGGDLIIAIDGILVRGIGDRVLQDLELIPRELVHMTIQRKGQEQTLAVRPLKRQSTESRSPSGPWEKYQTSPAKP